MFEKKNEEDWPKKPRNLIVIGANPKKIKKKFKNEEIRTKGDKIWIRNKSRGFNYKKNLNQYNERVLFLKKRNDKEMKKYWSSFT